MDKSSQQSLSFFISLLLIFWMKKLPFLKHLKMVWNVAHLTDFFWVWSCSVLAAHVLAVNVQKYTSGPQSEDLIPGLGGKTQKCRVWILSLNDSCFIRFHQILSWVIVMFFCLLMELRSSTSRSLHFFLLHFCVLFHLSGKCTVP